LSIRTKEKENRSKEMKPEVTHLVIFFFVKHKEDLAGGTTAAKTSPPPYDRSGAAGTGAPKEPGIRAPEELGARAQRDSSPMTAYYKRAKMKSEQEKALNKTKTSKQLTDT